MPRFPHSVNDQALTPASEHTAPVGPLFWEALPSGRLTQDLPAWRAYTGQPEPLPIAGWLDSVVHPEDRAATTLAWATALRGGQILSITHRLRAADGRYRPFLTQARPVFDDDGNVVRFQGVTCDLTDVQRDASRLSGQAAAFSATREPIILTDQDLRVLDWNPGAEELFGFTREEALGRPLDVLNLLNLIESQESDSQTIVDEVRRQGHWQGELTCARNDGTQVPCAVVAEPLHDRHGEPLGAIWMYHDATARTANEAELEAVLDTMTDAVYVYDASGRLTRANAAARVLNPWIGETSYLDGSFASHIQRFGVRDAAGEPQDPEAAPVARSLRGERVTASESVMRLDDGRDIRLSTSSAPIRNARGQITGAVSVIRDVTDRFALEQRNLDTLQALLDMATALVDEDGSAEASAEQVAARVATLTRDVLTCRRAALYRLAADGEQLQPLAVADQRTRTSSMSQREHGASISAHTAEGASLLARLSAGEVVVDHTLADRPPSGSSSAPAGLAINVPMRVAGELVGMMRVEYGPKDRARLTEELRLTEAMAHLAALVLERERLLAEREEARANELALRQANRRMDEFLGIASHELKTPLTTIKSSIQVLGRRIARGEAASHADIVRMTVRALDGMTRGVTRMERLVNDMLDVSRIREGRLDFHEERCDLLALVRAGVDDARQQQPERTITLSLPQDTAEIPMFADADRTGQVLANYLMNALKYSPLDRRVEVTVRAVGDCARVAVRDEGPGIPPDQQPHVWELFHRVPGIAVQHGSGIGVGLGLHISRTIVERHGGQVGLESAPGRGSTFWFELPCAAPEAE